MDDDSFKIELLSRLERIQALLSYLCGAAKAAEERAQAEAAAKPQVTAEMADKLATPSRNLIQEEMQDDYDQAVQRWKSGKT
jgi:uncharacterized protein (UPF0261 family)